MARWFPRRAVALWGGRGVRSLGVVAESALYALILGAPVIGALVYTAGVRRASRALRVLGVVIAFGVWVAVAVVVALRSE